MAIQGTARGDRVQELMTSGPPGVLAYDGDEVVGCLTMAYVGARSGVSPSTRG